MGIFVTVMIFVWIIAPRMLGRTLAHTCAQFRFAFDQIFKDQYAQEQAVHHKKIAKKSKGGLF